MPKYQSRSNTVPEQEKKRAEFEKLAFPHMESLYHTALRFTKNEVDAEDLVQDVYVRAFRFFHKFKKGTNFKAWIFKILTNTFINRYRKAKSQPQHIELETIEYKYADDEKTADEKEVKHPDEIKYDRIFDDEIKSALDQLPTDFRIVVLLADVESFSYKEIAKIIGRPIGTVMSRLSRGRKYLQQHLKSYAIEGGYINKPDPEEESAGGNKDQ